MRAQLRHDFACMKAKSLAIQSACFAWGKSAAATGIVSEGSAKHERAQSKAIKLWPAFVNSHLKTELFAAKLVAPPMYLDALFIQAFSVCDSYSLRRCYNETIMAANHDRGICTV